MTQPTRDWEADYAELRGEHNLLLERNKQLETEVSTYLQVLEAANTGLYRSYYTLTKLANPFYYLYWRVVVVPKAKRNIDEIMKRIGGKDGA